MKLIIPVVLLMLSTLPIATWCQESFSYQHGVDGYSSFKDVTIKSTDPTRSLGSGLWITHDTQYLLIQFDDVMIPKGKYDVSVSIRPIDNFQDGTVYLYAVDSGVAWDDPGSDITPTSGSVYPTWNHSNHDQLAWDTPGVRNGNDAVLVGSIPGIGTVRKEIEYTTEFSSTTTRLNFLIVCSGYLQMGNKESYSTTYTPILTLTPIQQAKPWCGLDWNAFLHGWLRLR